MELNESEREVLLRLARRAIEDAVRGEDALKAALDATRITPALQAQRGVFVTLKKPHVEGGVSGERLRGCVGRMEGDRPLIDAVVTLAAAAALQDPRFPPLTASEIPAIDISVSVLTAMQPAQADAIIIGRHGVELVQGSHRSVFLPQVAVEQGWSVERLLAQLAVKAGLPEQAWREASLSTFEAEAFAEKRR